jgi:hypothetical protein
VVGVTLYADVVVLVVLHTVVTNSGQHASGTQHQQGEEFQLTYNIHLALDWLCVVVVFQVMALYSDIGLVWVQTGLSLCCGCVAVGGGSGSVLGFILFYFAVIIF